MVWGAVIAAGASLAGSAMASNSAKKANQTNREIAERQMQFQKESAQNSYQWAMADMKKAGLNPMLAYQQGGASSLSGAGYTAQPEYVDGIEKGVHNAMSALRLENELDIQQETIKNIQADTDKKKSEWMLNDVLGHNKRTEGDILKLNINSAKANAEAAKTLEWYNKTPVGKATTVINKIGQDINPFANSAKTLKR